MQAWGWGGGGWGGAEFNISTFQRQEVSWVTAEQVRSWEAYEFMLMFSVCCNLKQNTALFRLTLHDCAVLDVNLVLLNPFVGLNCCILSWMGRFEVCVGGGTGGGGVDRGYCHLC